MKQCINSSPILLEADKSDIGTNIPTNQFYDQEFERIGYLCLIILFLKVHNNRLLKQHHFIILFLLERKVKLCQ